MTTATPPDLGGLEVQLDRRAAAFKTAAIVKIIAGLLSTLLVPLLLAGAIALFGSRQIGGLGGVMFLPLFAVMLLLMAIAYIVGWWTGGGFLMARLREIESNDGGCYEAITRDRTWRYDARGNAALWEVLLFAPRLLFEGFRQLRCSRIVSGAAPDAADIRRQLLQRDGGMTLESLRRPAVTPLAFGGARAYLVLYDWVGTSEDGKKVGALTESPESLGLSPGR